MIFCLVGPVFCFCLFLTRDLATPLLPPRCCSFKHNNRRSSSGSRGTKQTSARADGLRLLLLSSPGHRWALSRLSSLFSPCVPSCVFGVMLPRSGRYTLPHRRAAALRSSVPVLVAMLPDFFLPSFVRTAGTFSRGFAPFVPGEVCWKWCNVSRRVLRGAPSRTPSEKRPFWSRSAGCFPISPLELVSSSFAVVKSAETPPLVSVSMSYRLRPWVSVVYSIRSDSQSSFRKQTVMQFWTPLHVSQESLRYDWTCACFQN